MAKDRNRFIARLHQIGFLAAALMTAVVAGILVLACPNGVRALGVVHPAVWGTGLVFALSVAMERVLVHLLLSRVLKPTGKVAVVAMRVAEGDISMPNWAGRSNLDGLSSSVVSMVRRLQDLVGSIRQYSQDASAMAQQMAASTEQMTASTQEVASTTGDLTERANQQAQVVRAAAEDAGKILGDRPGAGDRRDSSGRTERGPGAAGALPPRAAGPEHHGAGPVGRRDRAWGRRG
jgi:methyl-accepting chemotaxis protein